MSGIMLLYLKCRECGEPLAYLGSCVCKCVNGHQRTYSERYLKRFIYKPPVKQRVNLKIPENCPNCRTVTSITEVPEGVNLRCAVCDAALRFNAIGELCVVDATS